MKKVISMLMAVLMIVSMAACSGSGEKENSTGKDPKELYKEASEKMEKLEEMDTKMVMKMDMSAAGQSVTMNMDVDIQSSKDGLAMKMSMDAAGQNVDMNMWYKDNYLYMDVMGQKMKMASTEEDALASAGGIAMEEIESDIIKDISAKTEGENTVITFTADGSKMLDYAMSLLSSSDAVAGAEDVQVKDVACSVTVNKDTYITKMTMNLPMTMKISGQSMEATIDLTMTYNNVGQPVNITFPDFSGYAEVQQ